MIERSQLRDRVLDEIQRIVVGEGLELVHAAFKEAKRRGKLELFIDKPGGVTLHDCEIVSRLVGAWLDVENPFPGRYDLEVASPGLDRLFYRKEDYAKFAGRRVKTTLVRAREGSSVLRGRLVGIDGETVTILDEANGHQYNVELPDIRQTRLEVEL